MIQIAIALIVAQAAPDRNAVGEWVHSIFQSPQGVAARDAARHERAVRPRVSTRVVNLPPPSHSRIQMFDPAVTSAANDATHRAYGLLHDDKFQEACDYVTGVRKSNPEAAEFMDDVILKCELLAGRYKAAYQDAVGMVDEHAGNGTDQCLYLALAAAAQGQVFPGQAKFCEDRITNRKSTWPKFLPPPIVDEETPKGVMLLSCLALGSDIGSAGPIFLEAALRLDPTNEMAAHGAIDYYVFKQRYPYARRVAEAAVAKLSAGPRRDYYLRITQSVGNKADEDLDRNAFRPKSINP